MALVDGRSLYWSELRPTMSELSGGEALQEVVLDRLLERELQRRGVRVRPDDVDRERMLLAQALNEDPNVAVRLLKELRRRRRLGPTRYQALLRRNAALRNLVQDQVDISEAGLHRTYEIIYGARRQVRLITAPTLADAERALRRIEAGEHVGDVALELSVDASAARGGLLEPISRVDPGYPAALREAIWELEANEVSTPILLDGQYAIVQLVRSFDPQDVSFDDVRADVMRIARLNQERLLMERLARQLLGSVTVTFFDQSVEESYRTIRRDGGDLVRP